MEVQENNKLIHEFMGGRWFSKRYPRNHGIGAPEAWDNLPAPDIIIEKAKYHSSWDWLMPVVGKIKKMEHDPKEMFMGITLEREMMFTGVTQLPICTTIEMLFKKIVGFIQWFNTQKQ